MKEQKVAAKKEVKPSEEAQLALNALIRAAEKVEKEEAEAVEFALWKSKKTKAS
jgi:hypothetical protein